MSVIVDRNEISDTIPGFKDGGDVYVVGENCPFRLRFTKSSMFDVSSTPEQWRDLSIMLKDFCQKGESNGEAIYLGIYGQQDSLLFKGYPAADVLYAVKEGSDTLAHLQVVVLRNNKDLFYLNYIAPLSAYNECREVADSIMSSIRFK